MPTFIFKCEGCGGQKPFPIHEAEMAEIDERKPIQKQCPTCQTMTNWMLVFPDRRSGGDRRKEAETVSQ